MDVCFRLVFYTKFEIHENMKNTNTFSAPLEHPGESFWSTLDLEIVGVGGRGLLFSSKS